MASAAEGTSPTASNIPNEWVRHVVGERCFFRWTGQNPATGQWYSKPQKDESIQLQPPDAARQGIVVSTKDESIEAANLEWFDTHYQYCSLDSGARTAIETAGALPAEGNSMAADASSGQDVRSWRAHVPPRDTC